MCHKCKNGILLLSDSCKAVSSCLCSRTHRTHLPWTWLQYDEAFAGVYSFTSNSSIGGAGASVLYAPLQLVCSDGPWLQAFLDGQTRVFYVLRWMHITPVGLNMGR
jgi:hypothetical protein